MQPPEPVGEAAQLADQALSPILVLTAEHLVEHDEGELGTAVHEPLRLAELLHPKANMLVSPPAVSGASRNPDAGRPEQLELPVNEQLLGRQVSEPPPIALASHRG